MDKNKTSDGKPIWAAPCKNVTSEPMRTAKTQIRLRGCAVWSGSSLSAYRIIGYCMIYQRITKVLIRVCGFSCWSGILMFPYHCPENTLFWPRLNYKTLTLRRLEATNTTLHYKSTLCKLINLFLWILTVCKFRRITLTLMVIRGRLHIDTFHKNNNLFLIRPSSSSKYYICCQKGQSFETA